MANTKTIEINGVMPFGCTNSHIKQEDSTGTEKQCSDMLQLLGQFNLPESDLKISYGNGFHRSYNKALYCFRIHGTAAVAYRYVKHLIETFKACGCEVEEPKIIDLDA